MQLAFTTVDEFHGLLEQAGEALDYREVWPRLFPVANCPPELMRKLVADIVEGDERFAWESDVHVGLAAWRAQRRDLADVAFTVVDIETTGATPGFCKITEIGAVRIEGGREVGTFSALVNPGMPIPTFITGITGIDDDTVAGAPPIEVVLPKFVDFAAHSVLVAHNAPFDLGFLDYELGKQRGQTFPRPALDTLRMARKLCPQQQLLAERPRLPLRHPGQAGAPRAPRRAGHGRAAPALPLLAAGAGHEHARGGRALLRAGHAAQLPQDLAHREGPDLPRRVHHARRQGGAAVRRQGREPAAPHARPLPAAPGVPRPPGARAARAHRRRRDGLRVRRAAARGPAHRQAPAAVQLARHARRQLPLRQAQRRGVPAPVRHAQPARRRLVLRRAVPQGQPWPGASSRPSTAPTRCAPAPTCRRAGREHACQRAGTGACLSPCRQPLNGEYAAVVGEVRRVLEGDGDELDARLVERQQALVKQLAFEQAARLQNQRETLERVLRTRAPHARRRARRPRARLPRAPPRLGRALGRARRPRRRGARGGPRRVRRGGRRGVRRRARARPSRRARRCRRRPSTSCCSCTPGSRRTARRRASWTCARSSRAAKTRRPPPPACSPPSASPPRRARVAQGAEAAASA